MIRVKKENHRSWFMSNYYPCEFVMNGIRYKNAEAAFQSHKVPLEECRQFADMPPASAKRFGRNVAIPANWDEARDDVMRRVVMAKFEQNEDLKQRLLETGTQLIEEDTTSWHDNYWGNCHCPKCQNIPGQNRLGTVFTPDEYVQARGDIDIHTKDHKVIYTSGLADVVKNNTVYCIKFISSLAHKHFLQCACSMIALGLPYGVVWNVKSNLMYSVKIKDIDALIDAITKCITKRVYDSADDYTCRKGFVQDTASIIDRWTDDGYAEEATTITSGDGIAIIKQGSRYFVMDGARRNTLNDNFGLGFADVKDACLAYAKSCELQKIVDHDSPYSEVEFWLDQNKAFEEYMTQVSHEIEQHKEGPYAKYKSFAAPAVRKMLAEKGLTIMFPEKALIKVWKMRRAEDAMYQKIEEAKKQNSPNVPLDEAFFDSELVDSVEGNTENTKAKAKPQKESTLPFSKYGADEKKSYRVVKSPELSKPNQPRYVVVETATDKVLDNANGYGYLSYQAAWKGYSYKSKHHLDGTKKPISKSAKEQAKKKAAFFSTDSEQLSFG